MTTDPASIPAPDPDDDVFGPPAGSAAAPEAGPPADGAPAGVAAAAAAGGEAPEPMYYAVEDWVLDHFLPMYRRTLGGEFRWCAQWWKHDEAVSRLIALWHAWEFLRLQPGTGLSTWYRDHLDHQLPILMGARGPFYQCSETSHREPRETIVEVAPGDAWDDADTGLPPVTTSTKAGGDHG